MNYSDLAFLADLKDYLNYDIVSIKVIRKNLLFTLNDVSINLLDSIIQNYNYEYLKINLKYDPYEDGYALTIYLYEKEGD